MGARNKPHMITVQNGAEASALTRQELRAILANPESTEEQVLQVKLLLAKRIAGGTNRVREICERYHLPSEKSEELVTRHEGLMGELEAIAAEEARRLKQLLAELHSI